MSGVRSIKDLVVFVTGGASGLGKGVVEHCLRNGAKVVMTDLASSRGEEVADQLKDENVAFTPADVTKSDDVSNALKYAEQRFHRLDAVVNCAGIGRARVMYNIAKELPHSLDDFDQVVRVNVTGTFNVMRLASLHFHNNEPGEDGQRGVIINTAGAAAFDGQQGQAAYAASNGAVVSMTLPAARDLAKLGVRVVTICPGLFDTPLVSYLPDKVRAYLADQVPSPPRFGHPHEFGHLVQRIIENPYINGETIRLDAGARLWP